MENYQPVVDDTPTPTPLAPTPVPTPNTVGPTFALPPMTPPTATPPPTTEPPLSITPAPGSADVYPALGCWTDDVTDRVLSGGFIKNQIDMTTEVTAITTNALTFLVRKRRVLVCLISTHDLFLFTACFILILYGVQ